MSGSHLIHWVGRGKTLEEAVAVLQNICETRFLRVSWAERFGRDPDWPVRMACFTEIPLSDCGSVCRAFGRFGIGFHRQMLYDYGARPVAYVSKEALDVFGDLLRNLETMHGREIDSEWNETDITADQVTNLATALALLQEYSHIDRDGQEIPNYDQREWRLPLDRRMRDRLRLHGRDGDITIDTSLPCPEYVLKFPAEAVAFLVVPRAYRNRAKPLASNLGCDLLIHEDEVR